jgi:CheY-like chemotaxis protein
MEKKLNCVLLVDDDDATNFMSRLVIERAGIAEHIEIALNGRDAIEYLTRTVKQAEAEHTTVPSILILLDINMPIMDGWEFLQAYKALDTTSPKDEIIIVMITTSTNPEDERRAEKIPEVAGFTHKPLRLAMVEEILKKHF